MLPLSINYDEATLALNEGTFCLARGRAGQITIIDVSHRRIVGNAVVGEDGTVACSNELAERVVATWLAYCSAQAKDPWPRPLASATS